MKAACVVAAMMALCAAPACAQAPVTAPRSLMAQHYQAYVEAFNAHDFRRAEAEGGLALEAAELNASTRIGVLAYNLASVRILQLHKFAEGSAPAERALAVGGPGVVFAQAKILTLLAQLPTRPHVNEEFEPLIVAITDDRHFQYAAAMAWGFWEIGAGNRVPGERAYRQAVAAGETFGPDGALDLSIALTALGSLELIRGGSESAEPHLKRAITLSAPFAVESVGPAPSYPEVVYYGAAAWFESLRSKRRGNKLNIPDTAVPQRPQLAPPLCLAKRSGPRINFPAAAQDETRVSTVVVRLAVDETGVISNVRIIVGGGTDFAAAVMDAAQQWRVEWRETTPGCRKRTDDLAVTVRFGYDAY